MTDDHALRHRTLRWPQWADGVVALLVLGWSLLVQGVPAGVAGGLPPLIAVALCLPYPWRQRRPRVIFAAILAIATLQTLVGVGLLAADVMIVLALYAVARRSTWHWSVPAAALVTGWVGISVLPRLDEYYLTFGDLGLLVAVIAVAWLAGTLARTREQYLAELVLRVEQAEREKEAEAESAAAAERVRIARDLHDIVSHSLSAISVLAAGSALLVENDPQRARQGMQDVETSSREALQQMRSMLSVLRSGNRESAGPQPGLAQLPDLVEESAATGLPVQLQVHGDLEAVPDSVQLCCYRVAQEALTNVRKHAGGSLGRVDVDIRREREAVVITISDDGAGVTDGSSTGGQGLIGMRERVTAAGGSLSTGIGDSGGFEVRAVLPLPEESEE